LKKLLSGILFFIFLQNFSFAQDLHYSQFYNSPMNINPALTGIFNGDKRIMASVRDQWESVPVPWLTFSGSYDQKIYRNNSSNFFGVGLLFNYDRQGDSRIQLTNVNLSASYNHLINKNNILTLGIQGGYANRGFSESALTWDRQWNGEVYDPNLSSEENFAFDMVNIFESAIGINYRLQEHERSKLDLGVGWFHLIEPSTDFTGGNFNVNLPRRISAYVMGKFQIADNLDLDLSALYQDQVTYNEFIIGGLLDIYVNKKRGKETNVHVGVGYRTSNSIFPKIAISYNDIYVSFSYDVDLSAFEIATDSKGGPELHFRYIIKSVKPLGVFKTCPIF
jgi:type IX secretion system PorP/SprF family membrane protein